ncbi:hypothetical protein BJF92_12365 [Rhizobium rhizosphaerae]|uniref:BioF2-like acetyltransferase domain-containing protein n=1 Tax=Xaviernesmea rhizosphaerae TaxID=1672749 RepID=A0A1Q9AN62_9HYPH|nr:GNAT family N-acetyltransferase [Xaviernesmea rhizosphaerae]OLP56857.1 hypothetical protein BJF92_12365 [Xaviernesmea rhizosphaerae]
MSELQLRIDTRLDHLEAAWRALEGGDHVSLHQGFDWCAAWVACFSPELALVSGRLEGRLLFILPLEIVSGRFFRIARFIGTPHSNGNTGLFAADWTQHLPDLGLRLAKALPDALKGRADLILLDKVPALWGGQAQPLAALSTTRHQNDSYQLSLCARFDETLRQLNAGNRRRKFRVSDRKLQALGGYRHLIARDQHEKARLLEIFFAQKAARFARQNLPDVFAEPGIRAFFHALAAAPARETGEALRLDALIVTRAEGDEIAAVAGLSQKGSHLLCQFSAIDEAIALEASPGEMLFHLIIERAHSEGLTLFDFGVGDQLYKRSWCNRETALFDVTLPVSRRGRAAMAHHRLSVALKTRIKQNPRLYGLLQAARRRMGASATKD